MLNTLRSIANDSLLIYDNGSDINFDTISDKTILLFSTAQYISSMIEKPQQITEIFVLDKNINKVDREQQFDNSEDLIFELADQLYHYYMLEAKEDSRKGDTLSAKHKEVLANRIHPELKKVHQNFSTHIVNNQLSISPITTLILLKPINYNDDTTKDMKNLFKDIVSDFLTFHNAEKCYGYLCTVEYNHSVFLIIDIHYEESFVPGFKLLNNVKQIYRYDHSSTTNDRIICNSKNLHFRLIHGLIEHYNNLGTEYSERKNAEKAKEMFLKAKKLCELLTKF